MVASNIKTVGTPCRNFTYVYAKASNYMEKRLFFSFELGFKVTFYPWEMRVVLAATQLTFLEQQKKPL